MNRWTQRWLTLLHDGAPNTERRFSQGRQLVQSGRVVSVRVSPGLVTGRVQGSSATPLAVDIAVAALDDRAWAVVAEALAGQVRHRARLLAGQIPEGLEAQLLAADVALFPRPDELDITCGCRDSVAVCAHAAALWLAAAALVDEDPFVLLRVRGRGRDRLLAESAAARSGSVQRSVAGVELSALDAARWTVAGGDVSELELAPLPEPATLAGPLRVLGDPPVWAGTQSASDTFAPLVRRGARWARALIEGNAGDTP